MLIGVCGKAGSGKDTIGDYLVSHYRFQKNALAAPIKRMVQDVFALDYHSVYDREAREQPMDEWGGWTVRKLLQFIGTELFRENIDDAIWVKSLWYKIKYRVDDSSYVITDIRFPNEIKYFEQNAAEHFHSIKVVRDGCDGNVGLAGHASESYDLQTEYVLINDGSIEDLYRKVDEIMNIVDTNKKFPKIKE